MVKRGAKPDHKPSRDPPDSADTSGLGVKVAHAQMETGGGTGWDHCCLRPRQDALVGGLALTLTAFSNVVLADVSILHPFN